MKIMQPILQYENYTIAWICALPVEVLAARFMLDGKHGGAFPGKFGDDNDYIAGTIHGHNVVIVGLPNKSVGTVAAASLVSQVRQSFPNLRYGLMVGTGGGVPGRDLEPDIRLGDVVVGSPGDDSDDAQGVIGYELGQETVDGFVKKNTLYPTDRRLRNAFVSIQVETEFNDSHSFLKYLDVFQAQPSGRKFLYPGDAIDQLFEAEQPGISADEKQQLIARPPRAGQTPEVHYGLIASGDKVMKNARLRDELRDKYNIMCFEMEAAGLLNTLPVAVIRGISNYADSHRTDAWCHYAAATAAAYAKGLLERIGADPAANPPWHYKEVSTDLLVPSRVEAAGNFSYSVDNVTLLVYLAKKTLRAIERVCGEWNELAREAFGMYKVLKRLRRDLENPDGYLNRVEDIRRRDLNELGRGCKQILTATNSIMTRYDLCPQEVKGESSPKTKFQDDETQALADIRREMSAHTAAISTCLDRFASQNQSTAEKQLRNLVELEGIPPTAKRIVASIEAGARESTVWTTYKDDLAFWMKLRRKLINDGYPSSVLSKHEHLIKSYIGDLGRHGAFDQQDDLQIKDWSVDNWRMEDGKVSEGGTEATEEDSADETPEEDDTIEEMKMRNI